MWSTLVSFVWTWWMVALVGALGAVIPVATGLLWTVVQRWLDRRYADDLPVSTGELVRSMAGIHFEQNPPNVLCVPPKHSLSKLGDSFAAGRHTILLTQKTFFKQDPSFWAIGAHELGHAILFRRVPAFVHITMACRALIPTLTIFAFTLMMANIALASSSVMAASLGVYWAVVLLSVLVCVDECAASVVAVRLLREDGRLRRGHWFGVYGTLGTAFLTYVGTAVGALIAVLLYDHLAAQILAEASFTQGPALEGAWAFWVLALAALLACLGVATLFNVLGPDRRFDPGLVVTNQQMERVQHALKRVEKSQSQLAKLSAEGTEPSDRAGQLKRLEGRRQSLLAQSKRLLIRTSLRALRSTMEVLMLGLLMWWAWDLYGDAVALLCVAAAIQRLQVVYGVLLMPAALVLVLALFIVLVPLIVPVVVIVQRLDRAIEADQQQRKASKLAAEEEAEHTEAEVLKWTRQFSLPQRLGRFHELAHLPWVILLVWRWVM